MPEHPEGCRARPIFTSLAVEDVALDTLSPGARHLWFYVSAPCVVVGKNQNPWRECDVAWCEANGLALARRVSGGGTVVHDHGNLNYAMILPRAEYRAEAIYEAVLDGLRELGLKASLTAGNSLTIADRKISGHAFCFRGAHVLHHGTMLVSSDLPLLRRALQAPELGIETRAIRSRPAPVINLADVAAGVSVSSLVAHLQPVLSERFHTEGEPVLPGEAVRQRAADMAAWPWVFGHTPVFSVRAEGEPTVVDHGVVQGSGRRFAVEA